MPQTTGAPPEILVPILTGPTAAGKTAFALELAGRFDLELINADTYPTPRRLTQVLTSRGIEGIVVLPLREPGSLAHCLDWSRFATVSVASSLLAPSFHHVTPHHFDNMLRACAALRAGGCRRIGLAISRNWDARVHHRWTGGIAWQNQFGGTEPVSPLLSTANGLLLDPDEFYAWLRRERPDAVISDTWDPALLAATVERFNGWSREGVDRDFHRGETAWERYYTGDPKKGAALKPLEKPPFFASPFLYVSLGTKGGPRTNERCEVLRPDKSVIAGLYCAGIAMAHPIGTKAVGAGTTIGPCLTFGYIAGKAVNRRNA